jgi:hypothetical protein
LEFGVLGGACHAGDFGGTRADLSRDLAPLSKAGVLSAAILVKL